MTVKRQKTVRRTAVLGAAFAAALALTLPARQRGIAASGGGGAIGDGRAPLSP